MNPEHEKELVAHIAATCEMTATTMSEFTARLLADELARFPLHQVLGALRRCRRELKGRLTLDDIIERLDDGRPSPNEAWSMVPRDEYRSVVWTEEMAEAYGAAIPLLNEGDQVAARMAFLEKYRALVQRNREDGVPTKWMPSLGLDPLGRADALAEAVQQGRITEAHALTLAPQIAERLGEERKRLEREREHQQGLVSAAALVPEHLRVAHKAH